MNHHVDLDELYPPTLKYMVYQHTGCCQFWIELQYSANTIRTCPMCQKYETKAIVGYSKKVDAEEYRHHLVMKEQRERYEFHLVRQLNAKIVVPAETRRLERLNAFRMAPSGRFFENWLNYIQKLTFPTPEQIGFNVFRNSILQPTSLPYPLPNETIIEANIKN